MDADVTGTDDPEDCPPDHPAVDPDGIVDGTAGDDLIDLAYDGDPEGDRLFFAGEATTSRYPSTAHGALWTGLREAHRLGVRQFKGAGMAGWSDEF